jgi:MinD-like ATPase involved in chromosome partitioning or flagellar assembly
MVCVLGAHSGVGVSTVSANLALCAQRRSLNRETALLDLNLYEGDLHLLLAA